MRFRYDTSGRWLKGNTHIHSTASDGGKTFAELAGMYASVGYDFLFRTDHRVSSDVKADNAAYPILWLDGIELDGRDHTGAFFHVICLGPTKDIRVERGFVDALKAARAQSALLVLAHPHWSGNSLDDCLRWSFDGVEIYNHVCHWLNGKSSGLVHWDVALRARRDTLAFAVDDTHLAPGHPSWNGGWIVVNAGERSSVAIMNAIRRGNFYSSCGPEFHSISWDGKELHLVTSPVRFVRIAGPAYMGDRMGSFGDDVLTDVHLPVPMDWDYVYVEIEDQAGRRAWTNNLFIPEDAASPDRCPNRGDCNVEDR